MSDMPIKEVFWLIEDNADFSLTVKDLSTVKELIQSNFESQSTDLDFDIKNIQYTITPLCLTQEEFEALPEA